MRKVRCDHGRPIGPYRIPCPKCEEERQERIEAAKELGMYRTIFEQQKIGTPTEKEGDER